MRTLSRLLIAIAPGVLTIAAPAAAQPGAVDLEKEKAAIVQAVLDYAEGYYGGEPARMTRAVSPYLSKRGLLSWANTPPLLVQMNADTLIDASHGVKLAPAERHITTEVMDVSGEIASARVFTAQFNDYLHLVKRGGSWQILNVLWHRPPSPPPAPGTGKDTVALAVRQFTEALFAADSKRALVVLHPLAHLRVLAQPPQGRPRIVREQNPDTLAAALASGQVKPGGKLEEAQIAVDGVDGEIAAARVTTAGAPTYLHLALQDGRWRVVNALMYPPPPAAATAAR